MGDSVRATVDRVRRECARVAARARQVRIEQDRIPHYAAVLPETVAEPERPEIHREQRHQHAAFWLTLDAINFGSGWFPTIRKRPGRSGYFTIAEGLREHFDRTGGWSAAVLPTITAAELARVLGQDPQHELMALFARSLRDLGAHLMRDYDGEVLGLVEAAQGSAVRLVEILTTWSCFADSSMYEGRPVPFLKRAQIAAADLDRAGVAEFRDLGRLTMFADNLVPHVLRLDGILTFDAGLVDRIEREELIEHGSPEEVEMRACAVHAVELIVSASPRPRTAAQVDQLLWQRGGKGRYKASPRPRARCSSY